ncbi:MAG: polyphosphate kinase 2 family protein [Chloroflexia bacterium]|nr:polyphosphate kinase 2 family protein [Chloroflexia bacterium]
MCNHIGGQVGVFRLAPAYCTCHGMIPITDNKKVHSMTYQLERFDDKTAPLSELTSFGERSIKKEEGTQIATQLMAEVSELQSLMIGAATHRVLLVLQGIDASGKDGVVRFVVSQGDPLNVNVHPFKMPTPAELAHDFLWRVHAAVPLRGYMGIFNRSHYEDVVAAYVRGTITYTMRTQRFVHIRHFEDLLHDDGTIIIKCFLHIDATEQEARLLAREQSLDTAWKLAAEDWRDRTLLPQYLDAYDYAMRETSHDHTPWYVVPANRKWYRNLVIAELIHKHMSPYRQQWSDVLQTIQRDRIATIHRVRASITQE